MKLLATGLCLTLFLSTPIHSYATEGEITVSPRFTYISNYSLSLTFNNGNAHIASVLMSKDSSADSYIKANLEKLTGSYWVQMKSFESSGIGAATLAANHPVTSGTYRVMGTFRCNTETHTAYTGNKTY